MRQLNLDLKTIEEVRRRVEYGIDIPDATKDLYYKGIAKREAGMDLICRARLQLQILGKWDAPLKGTNKKPINN